MRVMAGMDLLRFSRILGRSVRFLVAAAVLGAIVGAGIGVLRENTALARKSSVYYSATETLGYDASAVGSQSNGAGDLDAVGIFATGQPVYSEVAKHLGASGSTLAEHITTVVRPATNSVDVTAVAGTASGAERLAGAFATVT